MLTVPEGRSNGIPPSPRSWPSNSVEVWEIHNFTTDAHPIHIHEIQFEVLNRKPFGGARRTRETWESGLKDTVVAYPGEITRVKAHFDRAGLYVWHCHLVDHEDNEMMRPYVILGRPLEPALRVPKHLTCHSRDCTRYEGRRRPMGAADGEQDGRDGQGHRVLFRGDVNKPGPRAWRRSR